MRGDRLSLSSEWGPGNVVGKSCLETVFHRKGHGGNQPQIGLKVDRFAALEMEMEMEMEIKIEMEIQIAKELWLGEIDLWKWVNWSCLRVKWFRACGKGGCWENLPSSSSISLHYHYNVQTGADRDVHRRSGQHHKHKFPLICCTLITQVVNTRTWSENPLSSGKRVLRGGGGEEGMVPHHLNRQTISNQREKTRES